ncbi:helix-turn-helix domain-containing protein [Streptomyces varsoviensis]|uniref:TetR/AcrR family transcriptional regulator n=1 Tax=Streptomyces varsoviensis TaxID=67373 RepID=UPI0033CCFD28
MNQPTGTQPTGRRERKKAQTRKALADAALRLFSERGYDHVTVAEVAEAADVSVTTLFKHFPSKESLVLDLDADQERILVSAVRDRPAGQTVLAALRSHLLTAGPLNEANWPEYSRFRTLIRSTPVLGEYFRRMWERHEESLARAISEAAGDTEPDITSRALARFALQSVLLASDDPDQYRALTTVFELLERGWGTYDARTVRSAEPEESARPAESA